MPDAAASAIAHPRIHNGRPMQKSTTAETAEVSGSAPNGHRRGPATSRKRARRQLVKTLIATVERSRIRGMRRGRISAASMYLPQLHGGRKVPRADRVAPQRAETASAASGCQNHETDLLWRNNLPGVCVNIFAYAVPAFAEPETTVWVDQNENSPSYECSARRRIAFSAGYPHLNYLYSNKNGPVYATGPSRGGSRRSSMLFNGRSSEMFRRRRLSCINQRSSKPIAENSPPRHLAVCRAYCSITAHSGHIEPFIPSRRRACPGHPRLFS